MYYFIANIKINDLSEYQKYINESEEVFSKYKGTYLAVDNEPQVLEGDWKYGREVIICFENKEDFNEWYYSEDYQRILKYRLAAAKCDSILVKGLTE